MRFGLAVLKYFCGFIALVGFYVATMPGGIGIRLIAIGLGALGGGGFWKSREQLAAPVAVRERVSAEPELAVYLPEVDSAWLRMPVRHARPVYMHPVASRWQ